MLNKESFNNFILENKIITFSRKPITLSSGKKSHIYVNWRDVLTDAFSVNELSNYVISFVKEKRLDPHSFYGVSESMSGFGVITQEKWASQSKNYGPGSHVLSMKRGKPKKHGEESDKYFIGHPIGKTIILEDVVTSGSSLLEQIWDINGNKCGVIAAIVLTDRMELKDKDRFGQELQALRVFYHPLSNLNELLPQAYKMRKEITL